MTEPRPSTSLPALMRGFGPELWALRFRFLAANLVTLAAVSANALSPWPLKLLVDGLVEGVPAGGAAVSAFGREPYLYAIGLGVVFLVLSLASAFAESSDGLLTATIRERLSQSLRERMLAHLQSLPPTIRTTHRSGELVLRVVGDVDHFSRLWTKTLPALGRLVATTVATIAGVFWLSPMLGAACLVAVPLLGLVVRVRGRSVTQTARLKRRREGEVAAVAQEIVRGLSVIQATGATARAARRFSSASAAGLRAGVDASRAAAKMERAFEVARAVAMTFVMVGGALLVLRGWLTVGALTALAAYMTQLLRPIDKINALIESVSRGVIAGERLLALLALQPVVADRPDALRITRSSGRIELRDVWFAYPSDGDVRPPVLRGVNLTLEPNRFTVLVGASGAGKSTIVNLLVRVFDPISGSIAIDGRPFPAVSLHALRAQIAVMTQDLHLFAGTLGEALAPDEGPVDEARLWNTLALVALDDFVRGLPAGLDTPLGEDGLNLSGGQRQRLSLARALLLDRPILLLDEPLANVDAASAQVILDALQTIRRGRTLLAITHEALLLRHADAVYRLAGGLLRAEPPARAALEVVR